MDSQATQIQTGLTEAEQAELTNLIFNEWRRGLFTTRRSVKSACYDAYNCTFRTSLKNIESWIQKIRVFMPIMRMLVHSLKSSMVNFLLPNDQYLDVKADPVIEDFWTRVGLANYRHTKWELNTQENVLNAAIGGDWYVRIRQDNVFFEAEPIVESDIVITPLRKDIELATKILQFKKCLYELKMAQSQGVNYFNLEKLENIKEPDQGAVRNWTKTKNVFDKAEDKSLGSGFRVLEAHIPYYRFESTKREIKNYVVAVIDAPRILIRFEPSNEVILHGTWDTTPTGVYYGTGIVEPCISPLNYINSLMTAELVGQMLDAMSGFTYNETDEWTKNAVKSGKFVQKPFAMIGVGPNANIAPLVRPQRKQIGSEFYGLFKNELIEATNAMSATSGIQTETGNNTATFSNIQYNASSGRAETIAKWWDKTYVVPITSHIIKRIQKQLFQDVQDPMTGQTYQTPNMEMINFWMTKIGWDDAKKAQKLNDPLFMQALALPVEMSQIEPTGTQTVINRTQEQQSFSASIQQIRPEESPFIKWSEVSRERFKRFGVKNIDSFVMTDQELIQQSQMQQQQQGQAQEEQLQQLISVLESGVNPETGQPLSEVEMHKLTQAYEQMTGEPYSGQPQEQEEINPELGVPA